jgi:hypothetical protein
MEVFRALLLDPGGMGHRTSLGIIIATPTCILWKVRLLRPPSLSGCLELFVALSLVIGYCAFSTPTAFIVFHRACLAQQPLSPGTLLRSHVSGENNLAWDPGYR